ncbi:MAG: universal stress protein [Dehalococcoidia bacterium]|nr:universal stress protein [Dehalococcoidia bacterium]
MFTKVLVPLDGSEVSKGILPFVTEIAREMEIGVVLARAMDFDHLEEGVVDSDLGRLLRSLREDGANVPSGHATRAEPWASNLAARIERAIRAPLDDFAAELAHDEITAETAIRYGPASDAIIGMARETGCDLIAMSTRGRSLLASGILGSVTYKVLHESPLPVLAITPERASMYTESDYALSRVIVPLDGSELAETVLPYATTLAGRMNLELTLVRVVHDGGELVDDGMLTLDLLAGIDKKAAAKAVDYLATVKRGLSDSGIEAGTELLRGKISSEIAAYAHRMEHCMIALTTHGRSGASRLLLGSVAEAVVRESGIPVLVVRADTTDH